MSSAAETGASNPLWLTLWIIGGFVIVFPVLWCLIVWFLSHLGGWQRLARSYAAGSRPVTGERRSGVWGMVGWVSYRFVLTLHFTAEGFFIEVMPLFRIGHPRLFIPWTAISARSSSRLLWFRTETLKVGRPLIGSITLPAKVAAGPMASQARP